jgi:hypothetical protein
MTVKDSWHSPKERDKTCFNIFNSIDGILIPIGVCRIYLPYEICVLAATMQI